MRKLTTVLFAILLLTGFSQPVNALPLNGNFTDPTDWTYNGDWQRSNITTNGLAPIDGYSAFSGTSAGLNSLESASFVLPNLNYTLTWQDRTNNQDGKPGDFYYYRVAFYQDDDTNALLGASPITFGFGPNTGPNDRSVNLNSILSGVTGSVYLAFETYAAFTPGALQVAVDNVSIVPVPEPSTVAIVGLSLAWMGLYFRRRFKE